MPGQIQSIERAAAILRLLSGRSRRLGVAELAGELNLPKGTIHGILRTLRAVGFVEQDRDSGKYQLGAALLHMGSSYLDGNELRSRALNWSDALATRTGESVRIGTLHDNRPAPYGHQLRSRPAGVPNGTYLVTETDVAGSQYPALSDLAPALFVEECEAFEQFGLLPAGSKLLNRVLMAPRGEAEFPPVVGQRTVAPREVRAAHFVQGEAIEFPFGPVRAAGWESLYMGLVTTGEEILDLYLFHWHKHRAIERRLRGLGPERALFFVQRIEGLSAVGNGIAFCRAVEAAAGTTVSSAAAATRVRAVQWLTDRARPIQSGDVNLYPRTSSLSSSSRT